jgi:anaerobic magnesium-protoporphyrin IX monomethyl ester cyclase
VIDILFTSVPFTETDEPIMAPGLLKAIAKSAGYSSAGIDLNAEILNLIKNHPRYNHLVDFMIYNNLHSDVIEDINDLLDYSVDRILIYNPQTVGLSVLTFQCQVFTHWLCIKLKSRAPEIKILLGGTGLKHTLVSNKNQYCDNLLSSGLIDHYISGDADRALIEFLQGNLKYPGIDSLAWQALPDLDHTPLPDYNDYDFAHYDNPTIPIEDSRGCVRTCEFCDLIEHWKKFVYRSAESIFSEMIQQIQCYNRRHFSFKNSLTNGNLKEFRRLMSMIADYNQSRSRQDQISWNGYFIIRNESQHPEELWATMAQTNAWLSLGVESVVEHVRWSLGKKFYNKDIDYHLIMAKKYHVPLRILLIVGYPTETREDYEFTKTWFQDRVDIYGHGNPVFSINLPNAVILENTQLEKKAQDLNFERGEYINIWINPQTNITSQERVQYHQELLKICGPFNPIGGVALDGYQTLEKLSNEGLQ